MSEVVSQWKGISVLEQLHFHLVRKIVSGTSSVILTLKTLVCSVLVPGNDLAVLHITLSKFLNQKSVPSHSFKIMHLSHVV